MGLLVVIKNSSLLKSNNLFFHYLPGLPVGFCYFLEIRALTSLTCTKREGRESLSSDARYAPALVVRRTELKVRG